MNCDLDMDMDMKGVWRLTCGERSEEVVASKRPGHSDGE